MPNDDQLSPEDLTALMQMRASMEPGDPRGAKVDAFIKSQLQNYVPDANAQAQAFTKSQIKPLIPGTGTIDPTGGGMAAAQAGQNLAYNEQMRQSGNLAASAAGGMVGGAIPLGTQGLPGAIATLGRASTIGAGAGIGQLTSEPNNPQAALTTAAGTTAVGMALSPVAKFIQDLAGKAKAGPLFQAVNEAAGQNHVETSGMLQAAQEAQKLKQAGFGQMPQVLSKFIARMNSGKPLSFEDARLIEQAAGGKLSQAEAANMRPQMYAKLAQFADAARKATMQAAGQSGAAGTFNDALQFSRSAFQAQEKVDFTKEVMMELLKKAGAGAAAGAGGTAAGYATYKALHK